MMRVTNYDNGLINSWIIGELTNLGITPAVEPAAGIILAAGASLRYRRPNSFRLEWQIINPACR
jgi:hypothetical protein